MGIRLVVAVRVAERRRRAERHDADHARRLRDREVPAAKAVVVDADVEALAARAEPDLRFVREVLAVRTAVAARVGAVAADVVPMHLQEVLLARRGRDRGGELIAMPGRSVEEQPRADEDREVRAHDRLAQKERHADDQEQRERGPDESTHRRGTYHTAATTAGPDAAVSASETTDRGDRPRTNA